MPVIFQLPSRPTLKDLQYPFEWLYQNTKRDRYNHICRSINEIVEFIGPEKSPEDVFRADVRRYVEWLRAKGKSETFVGERRRVGARFFEFLQAKDLVPPGCNPFAVLNLPALVKEVEFSYPPQSLTEVQQDYAKQPWQNVLYRQNLRNRHRQDVEEYSPLDPETSTGPSEAVVRDCVVRSRPS
jgi:site-specific recombinase XerD